jgi:molybdenum cofactor cytidylyltransferase
MLPHSKTIGAVIVAAGGSSRLGQPKQLLRFRGKSLVYHIVVASRQAGCSPVIVVIGSDSEKVTGELRSTSAVIVENENWQRGIGSSIRAGIQGLIDYAPEIDAVVLLVCDQPGVNADTIRNLINLREATKKSIVASCYADTLGVPALFNRSLFDQLLSLRNEAGAKSIILRNRECVAQLSFPEGAIDIDAWEDWEKLNESDHTERSEEQVAGSGSQALSVRIIS